MTCENGDDSGSHRTWCFFAAVLLLSQMGENWQGGLTKLIWFYNLMVCGEAMVLFLRSDCYGRGIKMMLGQWLLGWVLLYVLGCFILAYGDL